jgi:hypothetical protein
MRPLCARTSLPSLAISTRDLSTSASAFTSIENESTSAGVSRPNGERIVASRRLDGNAKVLLEGDQSAPFGYVVPSPDGKHGALDITTGESNVSMVENY